jgi:hypothetical protein
VRHARHETDVQFARLAFKHTAAHGDAGSGQSCQPLSGNLRIGVGHRHDDACHAGRDQRVGARRRAAVMAAGFQRHIDGCTTRRFAGRPQCVYLGVRFAGTYMPALADHPAVAHDDAADPRIGRGRPQSPRGEPERTRHEFVVGTFTAAQRMPR